MILKDRLTVLPFFFHLLLLFLHTNPNLLTNSFYGRPYFFLISTYTNPKQKMSSVDRVMEYIDKQNLTTTEQYQLHRQIGNLIKRRMYYQLTVKVPWRNDEIYYDHTDRFEEVLENLKKITVDAINQEVCNINKLPSEIFVLNKNRTEVIELQPGFDDEQDIYNIFATFLGKQYSYHIEQFEVAFSQVDPYYK